MYCAFCVCIYGIRSKTDMILSVDDSFSNRVDQSTFEFDVLFVCISIIVFQFVHCDVIIPFVWKVVLLLLMTH